MDELQPVELPVDVLVPILYQAVPNKPKYASGYEDLLRVCKQWRKILCSPKFLQMIRPKIERTFRALCLGPPSIFWIQNTMTSLSSALAIDPTIFFLLSCTFVLDDPDLGPAFFDFLTNLKSAQSNQLETDSCVRLREGPLSFLLTFRFSSTPNLNSILIVGYPAGSLKTALDYKNQADAPAHIILMKCGDGPDQEKSTSEEEADGEKKEAGGEKKESAESHNSSSTESEEDEHQIKLEIEDDEQSGTQEDMVANQLLAPNTLFKYGMPDDEDEAETDRQVHIFFEDLLSKIRDFLRRRDPAYIVKETRALNRETGESNQAAELFAATAGAILFVVAFPLWILVTLFIGWYYIYSILDFTPNRRAYMLCLYWPFIVLVFFMVLLSSAVGLFGVLPWLIFYEYGFSEGWYSITRDILAYIDGTHEFLPVGAGRLLRED